MQWISTLTLYLIVLSSMAIVSIQSRTIDGQLRADATRFVQRTRRITNNPEDQNESSSNEAISTHTCQMECDGQGRLCETIASNVSEKMVCLKNRMQCMGTCSNKDLSKVLKKIEDKKQKKLEKAKKKQTIKNLGNSHIYTIEEEIKFFFPNWWRGIVDRCIYSIRDDVNEWDIMFKYSFKHHPYNDAKFSLYMSQHKIRSLQNLCKFVCMHI